MHASFHGPSTWAANQAEFGFFVDHFTFLAGLLYAAAHGPGRLWVMKHFRSEDWGEPMPRQPLSGSM
jgi:uncharacterized membrane protein YphA (DoxX/SURF4 family)